MRYVLIAIFTGLTILFSGCNTLHRATLQPLPGETGFHPSLGILPFEPVDRPDGQSPGMTDIIHQAESLFIPYRLRNLLDVTGDWNKVRLIPAASRAVDWRVEGRLLQSDPDSVRLRVIDQADNILLEKDYAYTPAEGEVLFSSLFDPIMADLDRLRLGPEPNPDLARVRFAADLLPAVFSGYLEAQKDDPVALRRLPAEDDPVFLGMQQVFAREADMLDAMDAHYGRYYFAIEQPYTIWREAIRGDARKMTRYEKRSWLDPFLVILGELTSGGGLFVEAAGNPGTAEKVYEKGRDWSTGYRVKARLLRNDLDRAGMLVSSEMKPFTVEIRGKVASLTGTAAEQYEQWRDLLGKMYTRETGIPLE
ncbi:MAG: hypothetical protein VCG02_16050 [Verrucomicrobiota bacterium]